MYIKISALFSNQIIAIIFLFFSGVASSYVGQLFTQTINIVLVTIQICFSTLYTPLSLISGDTSTNSFSTTIDFS